MIYKYSRKEILREFEGCILNIEEMLLAAKESKPKNVIEYPAGQKLIIKYQPKKIEKIPDNIVSLELLSEKVAELIDVINMTDRGGRRKVRSNPTDTPSDEGALPTPEVRPKKIAKFVLTDILTDVAIEQKINQIIDYLNNL